MWGKKNRTMLNADNKDCDDINFNHNFEKRYVWDDKNYFICRYCNKKITEEQFNIYIRNLNRKEKLKKLRENGED